MIWLQMKQKTKFWKIRPWKNIFLQEFLLLHNSYTMYTRYTFLPVLWSIEHFTKFRSLDIANKWTCAKALCELLRVTLYKTNTHDMPYFCIFYFRPRKRETLFYGGWTFQEESFGWDFFFCIFPSLSGGKNDSPKKTKFSQKFEVFLEKNFGKRFSVISKKLQPNFLWLWPKTAGFT